MAETTRATGTGKKSRSKSRGGRNKKDSSAKSSNGRGRGGSKRNNDEVESLEDGFYMELADMLHAERQLIKALPKMAKAAQSRELRNAIEMHLQETEEQAERIEQVFELCDRPAKAEPCEGMKGIISENQKAVKKAAQGPARDAMIIAGAQKVEHYEIASYGTLCAWAEEMGEREVIELLEETLQEEKAADKKLSRIAEGRLNQQAEGRGRETDRSRDGEDQDRRSSRKSSRGQRYGEGYGQEGSRRYAAQDRNYGREEDSNRMGYDDEGRGGWRGTENDNPSQRGRFSRY